MEYPEIDKYASMDSPIHRLDPRAKIVSFLVLIFSVVIIPELKLAMLGLGISIFFLISSRLPLSFVYQHVRWVFLFILPFIIIMPFTVSGKVAFQILGLGVTYEGIRYGFLVAIRAVSAVLLIFPMMGTMKFNESIKALYDIKVPNSLVQMLMFTYRYIFTFSEEFSRMRNAMASKGFTLKTNFETVSTIGKAVGMLFIRAFDRAERVYQAMLSKGYTGNPKTLVEFKTKTTDYLIAIFLVSFAIILHIPTLVS